MVEDDQETIKHLKQKNVKIISTAADSRENISLADLKGPVAILVGNEGAGLPEEVIKLTDEQVRIEMPGLAESLNVGISAAVILYEVIRQRGVIGNRDV
jgi:tRNA G18 (ribose-2'-O)-methylase SpoU